MSNELLSIALFKANTTNSYILNKSYDFILLFFKFLFLKKDSTILVFLLPINCILAQLSYYNTY